MDEALELEDIDAAYCLLFLREVRDAAFATVDEEISAPAGCAGRWSVPTTRPNGIA